MNDEEFKLLLGNIIDWDNHLRSWFTSLAGITASLFISAPLTGFTSDVPEFIRIIIFIAFILISPFFFCYILHVFIRIHESFSVKVCLRDLKAANNLDSYTDTVKLIQRWLNPFDKDEAKIRDKAFYRLFQFRGFYPGIVSIFISLAFVFINYLENIYILLIFSIFCLIALIFIMLQLIIHLKIRLEIKKTSKGAGIERKGRLWGI